MVWRQPAQGVAAAHGAVVARGVGGDSPWRRTMESRHPTRWRQPLGGGSPRGGGSPWATAANSVAAVHGRWQAAHEVAGAHGGAAAHPGCGDRSPWGGRRKPVPVAHGSKFHGALGWQTGGGKRLANDRAPSALGRTLRLPVAGNANVARQSLGRGIWTVGAISVEDVSRDVAHWDFEGSAYEAQF